MAETNHKPVLFSLDHESNKKMTDIAKAMSRELGVPVSRSAALRRLIATFSLPAVPENRTIHATTEKVA